MNPRAFTIAALLTIAGWANAQTAYLWPEADPAWKSRITTYWKKNDLMAKGSRERLIEKIGTDNTKLSNELGLKAQKAVLNGGTFNKVQRTQNPTAISLSAPDLLVNLTIGVKTVSDKYPYFKKGGDYEPVVFLNIGIYAFDGTVLLDSAITASVDYKIEVKPNIQSDLPSDKLVEEYWITVQAGIDKLVPVAGTVINRLHGRWMRISANKALDERAKGKFAIEMKVLLSDRKEKYPDHYSALAISEAPETSREEETTSLRGTETIPGLSTAQTAYLWTEADPDWRTRSSKYWRESSFTKTSKDKAVAKIASDNAELSNELGLKVQKAVLIGNSFKRVQRAQNPSTLILSPNDLLVNLTIGLKIISDKYPYFRKGGDYEPAVVLNFGIYAFDGTVVLDSAISVGVDYKTAVKPNLESLLPSEKTIEEYRVTVKTGIDKLVPGARAIIDRAYRKWTKISAGKALDEKARVKFQLEMNLVLSERKEKFPDQYSAITLTETQETAMADATPASRSTEIEERAAFEDKETVSELNEKMQGAKYYGLFIGMQDYSDPKINDLDNPVNDATRLRKLLIENYTFTPETSILLKNPTRAELLKALDSFTEKLTAKDNLLIFYAGHGLYDEQLKSGFWLLKDATQGSRSNWISNGSLRDYIGGIKAKHTLLVADACFSGGIFKTREAFQTMTKADLELYKLSSRKAMTSGAMKTVPDQSVFIEFLLKRLGDNQKPFMSSETLFASFKSAVINNSPNGQVPQFGEIRETGDEGGDFIFVRKQK